VACLCYTTIYFHQFYFEPAKDLASQLDGWLSKVDRKDCQTRAIIAPHAGYRYSGESAAYAYKHLVPNKIRRVFVLGPSHHHQLRGCALPSVTHYKTPFGIIQLDLKVIAELEATTKFTRISKDVDEAEHSIEMHLPFIHNIMKDTEFKLVPILVGHANNKNGKGYGEIFSTYFDDPENFFVVSSDFCHWGERFGYTYYDKKKGEIYQSIQHLDKLGMNAIESCDPELFSTYLANYNNTICGRYPIKLLLETIQCSLMKQKVKLQFIYYAQSSHCKSMQDSSVSYAAGIVFHN